jgi:DNA-binding transcriptional MocR family regulator
LQSMVNILAPFDLRWQKGLTFAWLNLPSDWRASDFTRMAESRDVLVRSADVFALVHGRAPHAVRLALAGGIPRAQFEGGLATLSQLLRNPPLETAV